MINVKRAWQAVALAAVLGVSLGARAAQAPAPQTAGAERTVWYFYKVRWGHQEEFLQLFRKNHYPLLAAQLKRGRLTAIRTFVPTYHGDGRADWTFAVALTFRDATALVTPVDEAALARELFPDQETFQREERRRFEILDAHWDVPLNEIDMSR
ncbi:MAG TPA: hypothetical protein VNI83_08855 [Vicinamibacterales bacterium]|nr:hypothetical protein [Vicinamibacterales bacterium]